MTASLDNLPKVVYPYIWEALYLDELMPMRLLCKKIRNSIDETEFHELILTEQFVTKTRFSCFNNQELNSKRFIQLQSAAFINSYPFNKVRKLYLIVADSLGEDIDWRLDNLTHLEVQDEQGWGVRYQNALTQIAPKLKEYANMTKHEIKIATKVPGVTNPEIQRAQYKYLGLQLNYTIRINVTRENNTELRLYHEM